jgi:hypothetical protein
MHVPPEIHIGSHFSFERNLTDSGIGIEASPVANASATVPNQHQKQLPLTFLCESHHHHNRPFINNIIYTL